MEYQKTCADCVNMGRAIYCMQCKRLKNGFKDMFLEQVTKEHTLIEKEYIPAAQT